MGAYVVPEGGWRIHNYKIPQAILMGFEYEIACNPSPLRDQTLKETLPGHYSYCYEHIHGSQYGYEIKSSVAPLLTLKQEVKRIGDVLAWPVEHPTNGGGIHVNVSRNDYTQLHERVVFEFLHNPKYYDYLLKLSAREHRMFNEYSCQNGEYMWARYYGVITKRKTFAYEFRMFSAEPKLLIPAIEMVHALFDMAPNHATHNNPITKESFEAHVARHARYKNLHRYIREASS